MQLEEMIDQCAAIAGSQRKLAAQLGVTSGNVSDWRNGRRPCPAEHLHHMAEMLPGDPTARALEVVRSVWVKRGIAGPHGAVAMLGYGASVVAAFAAQASDLVRWTTMYRTVNFAKLGR